jgi:hypothetical protein
MSNSAIVVSRNHSHVTPQCFPSNPKTILDACSTKITIDFKSTTGSSARLTAYNPLVERKNPTIIKKKT